MKKVLFTLLMLLCIVTIADAQIIRRQGNTQSQSKPNASANTQSRNKPTQSSSANRSGQTRSNSASSQASRQRTQPTQNRVTTPKPTPQAISSQNISINGVSFDMMKVEGGTFTMGATSEQGSDASSDEKPAHNVTLSSYYIGKTEVTQALWKAVMGNNPSSFQGDNLPVEQVSWNDCQQFISKLNSMTGKTFRLPTEAEWEFAARGGNNSKQTKYSGSNYLNDVAWYSGNSGSKTHPVGTKQANELGIHDMSGNVYEWCSDYWYGSDYYKNSDSNNPRGAYTGSCRVNRGGGWCSDARSCRSSRRSYDTPDNRSGLLGLRLVLVP